MHFIVHPVRSSFAVHVSNNFYWDEIYSPVCEQMNRNLSKTSAMCSQACAFAQSDLSLHCPHEEHLHPWLFNMRAVKILIRLCECAGWSESSLGTHVQRYVFWRCGWNHLGSHLVIVLQEKLLVTDTHSEKPHHLANLGGGRGGGGGGGLESGVAKVCGVRCGEGVYFTSPWHPTDIGLQLDKACYPCSR